MSMVGDLRQALRLPARRPLFCALVVALLAIGIGANTAVFSVLNAVALRSLPYRAPDRLYLLQRRLPNNSTAGISVPELEAMEARARSIEGVGLLASRLTVITGPEGANSVNGQEVTRRVFDLLGTPPLFGRLFRDADFESAAPRTVLLSHRLWTTRYQRDPSIQGRQIMIGGEGHTVIGVMPPEFQTAHRFWEFWTPRRLTAEDRANHDDRKQAIVLVREGEHASAATEIKGILDVVAAAAPPSEAGRGTPELRRFEEEVTGRSRRTMLLMMGAVSLVLLVACLNVAVLLLARSNERRREMALRAALGAGRARLIRHGVAESVMLAGAGGVAGVAVAWIAQRGLMAWIPERTSLQRIEHASVDLTVMLFALGLALLTGVACGLAGTVPALRSLDLNETLKDSSRTSTSFRTGRFRAFSLVFQTALSLVLLTGSALLLRSLSNTLNTNPGFRMEGALTARVALPPGFNERARQAAHYRQVLETVRTIPGVQSVGLVNALPLGGLNVQTYFAVEGRFTAPGDARRIRLHAVSPDYFRAIGIPLLEGRSFRDSDTTGAPAAAIVNQLAARRLWPNESAVGKRVSMSLNPAEPNWMVIVGVVGDARYDGLQSPPAEALYRPYAQFLGPSNATTLVLRTGLSDPLALAAPLKETLRRALPGQPLESIRTIRQVAQESVAQPRFTAALLGVFAAAGLALACFGIFGAVAYSVTRRIPEVAIRMALGAPSGSILRIIAGPTVALLACGIVVGAAGAVGLTRLLTEHLYQVTATDPATYAAAAAILLGTGVAACWAAGRRALRVDPASALRE